MFGHFTLAPEGFGDDHDSEVGFCGLTVLHGSVMSMEMRVVIDFELDGVERSGNLENWSDNGAHGLD